MMSSQIFNKILQLLVKIMLIPLSTNSQGEYCFRLLSLRSFLSLVIWAVIPCSPIVYSVVTDLMDTIKIVQTGASFKNITTWSLNTGLSVVDFTSLFLMPLSLGHLIHNSKELFDRNMRLPSRWMAMTLFNIANVASVGVWAIEEDWNRGVYFITGYLVYTVYYAAKMFIVNSVVSTFVWECKNLATIRSEDQLIIEIKRLIRIYSGIKNGLEPIMLFNYTNAMVCLLAFGFIESRRLSFTLLSLSVFMTIVLWNLSTCCQDCFEELQKTKYVIRYLIINLFLCIYLLFFLFIVLIFFLYMLVSFVSVILIFRRVFDLLSGVGSYDTK